VENCTKKSHFEILRKNSAWQHFFKVLFLKNMEKKEFKCFGPLSVTIRGKLNKKKYINIMGNNKKKGIFFLNPGFVFWLLVIVFVELNVQIIRKNVLRIRKKTFYS
jgi:hypothetical protein